VVVGAADVGAAEVAGADVGAGAAEVVGAAELVAGACRSHTQYEGPAVAWFITTNQRIPVREAVGVPE
jgi:hypothetical protein